MRDIFRKVNRLRKWFQNSNQVFFNLYQFQKTLSIFLNVVYKLRLPEEPEFMDEAKVTRDTILLQSWMVSTFKPNDSVGKIWNTLKITLNIFIFQNYFILNKWRNLDQLQMYMKMLSKFWSFKRPRPQQLQNLRLGNIKSITKNQLKR